MLLSSPSKTQPSRLPATGTPVFMAERPEPDLDRVREAMRDHDERQEEKGEPPEEPPREEPPEEDEE
jgi:endonuclease V-like protein UPF0215 family